MAATQLTQRRCSLIIVSVTISIRSCTLTFRITGPFPTCLFLLLNQPRSQGWAHPLLGGERPWERGWAAQPYTTLNISLDRGMVSGLIFLALKKAFDTVDRAILLKKLSDYGVQGRTAFWFESTWKTILLGERCVVCKKSYHMWRSTGVFIRPTLVSYLH